MNDKDTIYRQDAIKTIKDADVFVAYHEKDPIEEAIDRAIRATKRSVIYDIEMLPSAEQCITATSNTMVSDTVKIPVMDGTTERLPSAQPKGHWVFVHPLQKNDNGSYMCSECKVGNWEIDPESYFFCPNCGADMREGEEE